MQGRRTAASAWKDGAIPGQRLSEEQRALCVRVAAPDSHGGISRPVFHPSTARPRGSQPPSSGVWGAVLLGPVSVCFTLLFLVPVLTEEKVKRECMIIPRLGKAVFSLVQCKKGSEIQRGYDIIALEGILKGLT